MPIRLIRLITFLVLCVLVLPAGAVPVWGAKQSSAVGTPPEALKPGEWIWDGDAAPAGPMAVVVSLTEQRAYVYRNGLQVGVTTVSTGKPGHETPTGVFTILQKDKDHHSSKYNNAAMPWQERLTWDGIALHAGGLPGYPESHGCVHLPSEFARLLFEASHMGMTVVIGQDGRSPRDIVHPHAFMPVDAGTGAANVQAPLAVGESYRWNPQAAATGTLSILMSGADQRVLVFRDGVEIGRARISIHDPQRPLGTHVFTVKDGFTPGANPHLPGAPIPRWIALDVPGGEAEAGQPLSLERMQRISLPPAFAALVYPLLVPGATLMVTDAAVLDATTGVGQRVLDAAPPPA
jgi:hypothetical protein